VSVIMNGVDLQKFSPDNVKGVDEFRRQWKLEDRFVCSYVGTIGMAHGLDVVLEAAEQLRAEERRDVVFLLVGDGARRAELEAAAEERGLADGVIFTGRQTRELMPTVLAASDACLIHLKATELFGSVIPSKIFETMAMARPIIMGVRGEALDIVMDAGAGVEMQPESVESLLACIDQLAGDERITEAMRVAARQHAAEHFSRDKMAQTYLDLLCSVAGHSESVEGAGGLMPPDDGSAAETTDRSGHEASSEIVSQG